MPPRIDATRAYEEDIKNISKEGKKIKEYKEQADAAALFKFGQHTYDAMDVVSAATYKSKVDEASKLSSTEHEKVKRIDQINHDMALQQLLFPRTAMAKQEANPEAAKILDNQKKQDIAEKTYYHDFVQNRKRKGSYKEYNEYKDEIKREVKSKYGALSQEFETQLDEYADVSKNWYAEGAIGEEEATINKYVGQVVNSFLNGSKKIDANSVVNTALNVAALMPQDNAINGMRETLTSILPKISSPELVQATKAKLEEKNLHGILSDEEWAMYTAKASNSEDIQKDLKILASERVVENVRSQNKLGVGVPIKGLILPSDVKLFNDFLIHHDVSRMSSEKIAELAISDDVMKLPDNEQANIQYNLSLVASSLNTLFNKDIIEYGDTLGLDVNFEPILIPELTSDVLPDADLAALKYGVLNRYVGAYSQIRNVVNGGDPGKNNMFSVQEKLALRETYNKLNDVNKFKLVHDLYSALSSQDQNAPSKTDFSEMFTAIFGEPTLGTYLTLSENYFDEMQVLFTKGKESKKDYKAEYATTKGYFQKYLDNYLDKNLYDSTFVDGLADILAADVYRDYSADLSKPHDFLGLSTKSGDLKISQTLFNTINKNMLNGQLPFYVQQGKAEYKSASFLTSWTTTNKTLANRASLSTHAYVTKNTQAADNLTALVSNRNLDNLYVQIGEKFIALNADPALKGKKLSDLLSSYWGAIANHNNSIDTFNFHYAGTEKNSMSGNYNTILIKTTNSMGEIEMVPFTLSTIDAGSK